MPRSSLTAFTLAAVVLVAAMAALAQQEAQGAGRGPGGGAYKNGKRAQAFGRCSGPARDLATLVEMCGSLKVVD